MPLPTNEELAALKGQLEKARLTPASVADWLIDATQGNEESEQDAAFLTGCPRCNYSGDGKGG